MPKANQGKGRGGGLLGGVFILTVANLLVKAFGFLYKVPLNGILGDEMANVNAAYSVYALLYMISTAGIPVAVSVMVSGAVAERDGKSVEKILRVSRTALALIGALGTALMLILAPAISNANSGGDSYLCLLAIAPSLFFISICSVYRGYYQGFGIMTPTAVSEVIEAVGKTLLGLAFVFFVYTVGKGGLHLAAAYSVFGVSVGIALGCFYLVSVKGRYASSGRLFVPEEKEGMPLSSVIRRLFSIAFPIALTSGVMSASSLLDAQLMRPLLERYYGDAALAKAVYSDYSTGALTLFNLPVVFIYPIASAIVPYITAARHEKRPGQAGTVIATAFRLSAALSIPISLFMSVFSRPLLSFVFLGDGDMAQNAGDPFALLALSVFPMALLGIGNAVLQANGEQRKPVLSMMIGISLKLPVLLFLTPVIGPSAAPLGSFLFYSAAALMNLYFIFRKTSFSLSLGRPFLAPLLSSFLSSLLGAAAYRFCEPLLGLFALFPSGIVAFLLYAFFCLSFGCVSKEDLLLLPKGEKLVGLFKKTSWIK